MITLTAEWRRGGRHFSGSNCKLELKPLKWPSPPSQSCCYSTIIIALNGITIVWISKNKYVEYFFFLAHPWLFFVVHNKKKYQLPDLSIKITNLSRPKKILWALSFCVNTDYPLDVSAWTKYDHLNSESVGRSVSIKVCIIWEIYKNLLH